jgi:hypothetical protein
MRRITVLVVLALGMGLGIATTSVGSFGAPVSFAAPVTRSTSPDRRIAKLEASVARLQRFGSAQLLWNAGSDMQVGVLQRRKASVSNGAAETRQALPSSFTTLDAGCISGTAVGGSLQANYSGLNLISFQRSATGWKAVIYNQGSQAASVSLAAVWIE